MRKLHLALVAIFGGIGSYIPVAMGVDSGFGGWSILGGVIGGFVGIWLGVQIAKRY